MTTPARIERAARVFEGFHDYDMRRLEKFASGLAIPRLVHVVGPCISVSYRSDKWNEGTFDYIHTIESRPKVLFAVVREEDGAIPRQLPEKVRDPNQVLARIGKTLDAVYEDGSGQVKVTFPASTEWFFSPSSRALFAITDKRSLQCVIWGGKLNVEDRGIVG